MKRLIVLIVAAILIGIILFIVCAMPTADAAVTESPKLVEFDLPEPIVVIDPTPLPYDPDVDYMELMILSAYLGNMDMLNQAVASRNAKIVYEQLDAEPLDAEMFLRNFEEYTGFDMTTDYAALMQSCAVAGDVDEGRAAAEKRNLKIAALHLGESQIDFDDLYLLAKVITCEAGSYWLDMEWKMKVGEVVVNRVNSPEFPNSYREVIYQPGQYPYAGGWYFENLTPWEASVEAAMRLLSGERLLNDPSVVFQNNTKQGSGVHTALYDSTYGYTYLCYSNYPELYTQGEQ